jgi:hypothetical protein
MYTMYIVLHRDAAMQLSWVRFALWVWAMLILDVGCVSRNKDPGAPAQAGLQTS